MNHVSRYLFLLLFMLFLSACENEIDYNQVFKTELKTLDGEKVSLKEVYGSKATALIFYSPECPMCEKYTHTINQMIETYADENIKIIAVFPGPFYSADDILYFRHRYGFNAEILLDPENRLVRALSASITPEVFFLDDEQNLIYKGSIDNWMPELGRMRANVTAHYLIDAIEAFLNGEEPEIRETQAVGCLIELI